MADQATTAAHEVPASAPATNADRLRDAATTARTAARRAEDSARQLARFADLIAAHVDDSDSAHLTGQQISNLRAESESVVVALFRALTDAEHAQDCVSGLLADDPTSRPFGERSAKS